MLVEEASSGIEERQKEQKKNWKRKEEKKKKKKKTCSPFFFQKFFSSSVLFLFLSLSSFPLSKIMSGKPPPPFSRPPSRRRPHSLGNALIFRLLKSGLANFEEIEILNFLLRCRRYHDWNQVPHGPRFARGSHHELR